MAERKGRIVATAVSDAKRATVVPQVQKKVLPETTIYTDEYRVYDNLSKQGYRHSRVHHAEEIYVAGVVHTNTIEGFWSLLKRGTAGAYHSVSAKHLHGYLNEYAFRYNHRKAERPMFDTMLLRATG